MMLYLWVKAFHIISVIAWLAGLLYLPRLYVYHAMAERGSSEAATFAVMERRLLKIIMTPAMLASFGFGVWLLMLNPYVILEGWFMVKFALVVLMAACHGVFARMRRNLAAGENIRTPRYYRIWNEVPTALMVAIVILVIVRPI